MGVSACGIARIARDFDSAPPPVPFPTPPEGDDASPGVSGIPEQIRWHKGAFTTRWLSCAAALYYVADDADGDQPQIAQTGAPETAAWGFSRAGSWPMAARRRFGGI